VKLVTWNCCRGDYLAKRELIAGFKPDIAVIQEARHRPDWPEGDHWFGPNPRNGLSLVSTNGYSIEPHPTPKDAFWYIVPARLRGAITINLLAVWTRQETGYLKGLAHALDLYGDFLKSAPCVVIGDFNASALWDKPRAKIDFSRTAQRLADEFGLHSAYHQHYEEPFGAESRPTHYFRWNEAHPFHIDYCFVPKSWRIDDVSVETGPMWDKVSDHRPLVVEVSPDTHSGR
jgi:endonuclease/exonuclease/phosphatase family metal-dependent hydrolase